MNHLMFSSTQFSTVGGDIRTCKIPFPLFLDRLNHLDMQPLEINRKLTSLATLERFGGINGSLNVIQTKRFRLNKPCANNIYLE